jgi:hypothetical protein
MRRLFLIWVLLNIVFSVPAVALASNCSKWGNGRYEYFFPLTLVAYWMFDSCAEEELD